MEDSEGGPDADSDAVAKEGPEFEAEESMLSGGGSIELDE